MKRLLRPGSLLATIALTAALTMPSLAASDTKKVEHAVSGAAHRVSQGYHKQVKDYHVRQARHSARKGHYRAAVKHEQKAAWHAGAESEQKHQAHQKEKAVHTD